MANHQSAAKRPEPEAVYTAKELAQAARRVFGTSPDIAAAALSVAGIKFATIKEAEKIIKNFAGKEVK